MSLINQFNWHEAEILWLFSAHYTVYMIQMQVTVKLGPKNLILKSKYYFSSTGKEKVTELTSQCP
jgi:hypothetical protein